VKKNQNNRWDKVKNIWEIIERLRGESGCPWDRKQTPESVQTYLVEEAHEGAAAVRAGKVDEVAEELGDVLFMVFFLAYLYEQRGAFTLEDVCEHISEKMVRRHPHVFGDTSVRSAEEVKDNWEKIKAGEKSASGKTPDPVPESLPALMRAYRIISRAAQKDNGRLNDIEEQSQNFSRKSGELLNQIRNGDSPSPESIGEIFLELVNIARIKGYRAEDCLHQRLKEFSPD
jgi:MazG family protein